MKKDIEYAKNVNALFDELQQITKNQNSNETHLLKILRSASLTNKFEWTSTLESYLRDLFDVSAITKSQYDELQAKLNECINKSSDKIFCVTPLLWATCLVVMFVLQIAFNFREYLAVKILLGIAIVYLGWKMAFHLGWVRLTMQSTKQRIGNHLFAGVFALAVPTLVMLFSALVTHAMVTYSQGRYVERRLAFLTNPKEFPLLRDFAKEHFDIEMTLGTKKEAWISTGLTLPTSAASPAAMYINPGYCTLYMNKAYFLEAMGPKSDSNNEIWTQGVMMHEFAHCLDVSRDYPNFGQRVFKVNSISPADKAMTIDADTFANASEKLTTVVWREAFADVFTIGYWRMVDPKRAQSLALEWREHRTKNASDDPWHATSCWIDQSLKAEPPVSFKTLLEWSDHLRMNAFTKCTVAN